MLTLFGVHFNETRYWEQVEQTDECWNWTGNLDDKGYGRVNVTGGRRNNVLAHRVAWALAGHDLAPDQQLDHLCRNRRCVNPEHLEAVTGRTNVLRGESTGARASRTNRCHKGHDLSDAYYYGKGRYCRTCAIERSKERFARTYVHRRDPNRCPNGHERVPENIYIAPDGRRRCRQCRLEAVQRSIARKVEK